jgi:hypothetical protein
MSHSAVELASAREGISFYSVKGGGVLFNAADGRLYALNPAAALTWLCLRDGLSRLESACTIADAFNVEQSIAAEWLNDSMALFENRGLLGNGGAIEATASKLSPQMPFRCIGQRTPGPHLDYRLFEQSIRIGAPSCLQPAIDSLLGTLRIGPTASSHNEPCLHIDIVAHDNAWNVAINEKRELTCDTSSLIAELERLVVQAVVPATPQILTLHAAVLQHKAQTFLLIGHSGAGKTTLSVALAHAGWTFGSDELVLLDRNLELRALPLPACVKADTFQAVEIWFPELRSAPEHKRYGNIVKYLPFKSTPFTAAPTHVLFICHDQDSAGEIRALDSFTGLERMLAHCLFVPSGFRRDDVERLLRWHASLCYFEVFFNNCDCASALLASLGRRPQA